MSHTLHVSAATAVLVLILAVPSCLFRGRNVFTVIEGKSTPGGTGPFWAY